MANIVITGANRGIGLALVKQYIQRGDNVWALCRQSSEDLEQTGAVIIEGVDVGHFEQAKKNLAGLKSIAIDVLINNAGILRNEILGNLNTATIEEQFRVNTLAPLLITEFLLSQLTDGSKVAFVTSRMGSMEDNTSGGRYGYRMSKAALNAAGVSIARDLHAQGIAVAILHPGYVQTGMVNFSGEVTAEFSAGNLIDRIDELNLDNSGTFWHANGEVLPW